MVDHGNAGASVNNLRALLFADTENESMPGMPSATAVAGGYTSMDGMTGDTTRMATLEQMPDTPGLTNEPLFYAGLAMLLGSFGLSWWRQRRNVCQPLHTLRTLRAALDHRA
jgi:hypothetical protein